MDYLLTKLDHLTKKDMNTIFRNPLKSLTVLAWILLSIGVFIQRGPGVGFICAGITLMLVVTILSIAGGY